MVKMKEEKKKQTQVEYLKEQIKIHEEQLEIQKATFFRIEGSRLGR